MATGEEKKRPSVQEIETMLKAEIKYQWRVQSSSHRGCMCVAYIDARDAMEVLDNAVGSGNWQDEYYTVGGSTYCKLGVKYVDEWVWKSDTGAPSKIEAEKGLASDAFKRAAVKHGVGRFLYEKEKVWILTWKTTDYNGKEKHAPMHDIKMGDCPEHLRKKNKRGEVSLLLDKYKVDEYIRTVLKKNN